jgi:hypothetical protein
VIGVLGGFQICQSGLEPWTHQPELISCGVTGLLAASECVA